jgi:hypothetical protein
LSIPVRILRLQTDELKNTDAFFNEMRSGEEQRSSPALSHMRWCIFSVQVLKKLPEAQFEVEKGSISKPSNA